MTEIESCSQCRYRNLDGDEYPCYKCCHTFSYLDYAKPLRWWQRLYDLLTKRR